MNELKFVPFTQTCEYEQLLHDLRLLHEKTTSRKQHTWIQLCTVFVTRVEPFWIVCTWTPQLLQGALFSIKANTCAALEQCLFAALRRLISVLYTHSSRPDRPRLVYAIGKGSYEQWSVEAQRALESWEHLWEEAYRTSIQKKNPFASSSSSSSSSEVRNPSSSSSSSSSVSEGNERSSSSTLLRWMCCKQMSLFQIASHQIPAEIVKQCEQSVCREFRKVHRFSLRSTTVEETSQKPKKKAPKKKKDQMVFSLLIPPPATVPIQKKRKQPTKSVSLQIQEHTAPARLLSESSRSTSIWEPCPETLKRTRSFQTSVSNDKQSSSRLGLLICPRPWFQARANEPVRLLQESSSSSVVPYGNHDSKPSSSLSESCSVSLYFGAYWICIDSNQRWEPASDVCATWTCSSLDSTTLLMHALSIQFRTDYHTSVRSYQTPLPVYMGSGNNPIPLLWNATFDLQVWLSKTQPLAEWTRQERFQWNLLVQHAHLFQ